MLRRRSAVRRWNPWLAALVLASSAAAGPESPPQSEPRALEPAAQASPLERARERWHQLLLHPRLQAAGDALLEALRGAPPDWQAPLQREGEWANDPQGLREGLAAALLLLLALAWLRARLRPGDLVVAIEYPAELRGTFSVHLARRPPRIDPSRRARAARRSQVSTARDHHMVSRETQFRKLRPRRYWVWIEGRLEDPSNGRSVAEHTELRPVELRSRRTARAEFDLRPRGCPLEVRVVWDQRPVAEACVVRHGDPSSLRYARSGIARLELPPGTHRIAIGSGDRVAERTVELVNYQTQPITVELADADALIFRGCPPAVERYMKGDREGAARALEREGQIEVAQRLRAQVADGDGIRRVELVRRTEPDAETSDSTLAAVAAVVRPAGGRYDIIEQIGRGGMGIVFKARDKRLGRLVALKQLPENLRDHPTALELFLREARAAAALNHPNIVTLFDADEEDGKFFLTMELLEGSPLHRILRAEGPISPSRCARVGVQVAAGLQYAHARGIVHRDIKTSNLFWTRERSVKIMDFGLAKMLEEVRRSTTVLGGTPYYMAPEQSAGGEVDGRADLYSLGVTLFEMLTGKLPFEEGDVTYHHRHTPPPDPRSLLPQLPEPFADLLLALLAKRPEDRIASAEEVAARLQSIP